MNPVASSALGDVPVDLGGGLPDAPREGVGDEGGVGDGPGSGDDEAHGDKPMRDGAAGRGRKGAAMGRRGGRTPYLRRAPSRPRKSMKTPALLVALALAGCASSGTPRPGPPPAQTLPAGTYDLRVAAGAGPADAPALQVHLAADGRATVTDGTTTHVVSVFNPLPNDQIEVLDQSGPAACRDDGPIPGRYHVQVTAAGFELHAVDDPCEGRRAAMNGNTLVRAPR